MLDTLAALIRPQSALQAAGVVGVLLLGHFLVWQPYRRRAIASEQQGLARDQRRIAAVLTAMADLIQALEHGIVSSRVVRAELQDDFTALGRAEAHPDTSEELAALARRFERRAQALAQALDAGADNATLMPMLQALYAIHLEGSAMATRVSMQVLPPQR